MKTLQQITITAILLLASALHSSAIVGLGIERDCADIVISWPSTGNEHYLIQHRPSLDPNTPWQNLTNNYPANSTNRMTYRINNVVPPCSSGFSASTIMSASMSLGPVVTEPQVVPADGSRRPVPLAIYPPGIDLTGYVVIWPDSSTEDWTPKLAADLQSSKQLEMLSKSFDGPEPQGAGDGGGEADSGFYRVFHIPDFPNGITNYIFDGPIFIPVDFKDYRERIKNIEVILDGLPTELADCIPYASGNQTNWGMGIYFDRVLNGEHQIKLVSRIQLDDIADGDAVFVELAGITRTIAVDNQVAFTNWSPIVWNNTNYTFRAQTKNSDTDWSIDIYDAWGQWVNGNSGHTYDGQIEWTWDLRDFNGNLRDNISLDPFFDPWITFDEYTASGLSSGNGPQPAGATTTRPTPVPVLSYPDQGAWVITFQENFYDFGVPGHDEMNDCMHAIQGWVDYRNIPTHYHPLAYGTNTTTQAERDESWATLKNGLLAHPDFRNFYYYGHGGTNAISGDGHRYDTNGTVIGAEFTPNSKAYLAASSVKSDITFNKRTGEHHYRFVWLDGCNTAGGSWPDAFGINKATNSLSYYTNSVSNPSRKRPSAFVGWATTVGGHGWGNVDGEFFTRSEWIKQWSYYWVTETLVSALDYGNNQANWVSPSVFWGSLRVYGYSELKMNEYNTKTSWPP